MKQITVPLGPQHPSLVQPGAFSVTLEGDRITAVSLAAGYNHRGLEKTCEAHSYKQDIYIIERICGICSHTHSMTYCQAVEELAGVTISRRAAYIRLITAELERLQSHLMWLGVAAHEIGFDALFMYSWRDRERVLDCLCALGGNRVNYGVNTLGGVKRDIDANLASSLRDMVSYIEERNKYYTELVRGDVMLSNRLRGVGLLSREEAERLGVVGPIARASGLERDVRLLEPYAAYDRLVPALCTDQRGDVYGRTLVRLAELDASLDLIRQALIELPNGPLCVDLPARIPVGEAMSRTEAPRGENIHYLRSRGGEAPDRLRVRAASDANLVAMEQMLLGNYLADVPLIVAALDPCYSCAERCYIQDGGQEREWDWRRLRQYGLDWHRSRGFFPEKLRLAGRSLISLPTAPRRS